MGPSPSPPPSGGPSGGGPSAWRTLFAFASLAVLAGIAGFLAFARTGETDPNAVLAAAFEPKPLPFGFVPRFAAELPFGQKIVRVAAPDTPLGAREPPAAPEKAPEKEEARPAADPDGASPAPPAEEKPRIVWRKIALAPAGGPPREASLVFTGGMGKDAVGAYLEDPAWGQIEHLGPEGGWAAVEAATLKWDRFEPRYVIARRFEPPGTYRDSARVDLSAHGRWCVLCVDWERGSTASKEVLLELVRAFVPVPAPAETAAR